MTGDELEHLSDRDREILGMNAEPEESPIPSETHVNKVGGYIGYFILYAFLVSIAIIIAMLLAKGIILVYGWLF